MIKMWDLWSGKRRLKRRAKRFGPIRTYAVRVDGYDEAIYSARSPAKAMAKAWRDFTAVYDKSFGDFLVIAHVRRIADPPGVGERILVGGLPATRVYHRNQDHYVWFMRDDSDTALCSHPNDVTTPAAA